MPKGDDISNCTHSYEAVIITGNTLIRSATPQQT